MVLTYYLTCNIILLLKAFHCDGVIIRMSTLTLRYYAAFKARKFKLLFYKINTFLQKKPSCVGLQAGQIFSVNI